MLNSSYVTSAGLSAWYVLSFTHHIYSIRYILRQLFGEINSPICTTNMYCMQTAFSVLSDYSVCCIWGEGHANAYKKELRELTLNMWRYFLLFCFEYFSCIRYVDLNTNKTLCRFVWKWCSHFGKHFGRLMKM